jgi:hypothetical protein
MINAVTRVGLVGRGARLAHAIVLEQIAALLAPLYLVRHAGRDLSGRSAEDASACRPVRVSTVAAPANTRS